MDVVVGGWVLLERRSSVTHPHPPMNQTKLFPREKDTDVMDSSQINLSQPQGEFISDEMPCLERFVFIIQNNSIIRPLPMPHLESATSSHEKLTPLIYILHCQSQFNRRLKQSSSLLHLQLIYLHRTTNNTSTKPTANASHLP